MWMKACQKNDNNLSYIGEKGILKVLNSESLKGSKMKKSETEKSKWM